MHCGPFKCFFEASTHSKLKPELSALTRLHSVLYVPTDSHKPIRIIHPTFPEFLLRSPSAIVFDRGAPPSIPISLRLQPAELHWYLFSRCLEVMSSALKRVAAWKGVPIRPDVRPPLRDLDAAELERLDDWLRETVGARAA